MFAYRVPPKRRDASFRPALRLAVSLVGAAPVGAWKYATKLIEEGNHGGKHSDAQKASITGDTVGPAIHPTIMHAGEPQIAARVKRRRDTLPHVPNLWRIEYSRF